MKFAAKRWEVLYKDKGLRIKDKKDIVAILLKNRGLRTRKDIEEFLNPKLEAVTIDAVAIDKKQIKKAVDRIEKAIKEKEQIIVYGDYDVDGICGCAILWETLHEMGASVMPYIPHRVEEGYGLSIKGIENVILNSFQDPNGIPKQVRNDNQRLHSKNDKVKLIITVDNGIVANDAVDFANEKGIDVIITDHHVPGAKLPKASAIVHTTKLCGTGVAWMLAREVSKTLPVILNSFQDPNGLALKARPEGIPKQVRNDVKEEKHLELVALATIADLVPLLGANRTLTKFGLEKLRKAKRVGLLALFQEAGIDQSSIGTYEVGHVIAPRLNAMGRLESAMDSLRLLCTKDPKRAMILAHKLSATNKQRQLVTEETVMHAKQQVTGDTLQVTSRKLLVVVHETYQQGVIGLVAGKLVEEFYRPAIVIAKGEKFSKASARSVHGLNIIEFIRSASEFLVDAGGHPMAAGFTVETEKLPALQKALEEQAEKMVLEEMLTRILRIDCELDFPVITDPLYEKIQAFEPFGMANPQPVFATRRVTIEDMRLVGQEGRHLKLRLQKVTHSASSGQAGNKLQVTSNFDAIAFGMGKRADEFRIGEQFDIVYTIDEDRWLAPRNFSEAGNGNRKLQLKVKDIKKN